MSLPSPNPTRARIERYWLYYTPVWGAVSAIVMVGGFADRWGDVPLMLYGLVLAAGASWGPLTIRGPNESALPLHQRTGFKMWLSVVGLSFGLNYFQTPFFYDVLHMHYGFNTTINIRNNPVFLYFVTVAYFSTYFVLTSMACRWLSARVSKVAAYTVAPFAMAFLETALNANPFIKSLFCYDDMPFMLWFGTLSYGISFVFALPMWMAIDETRDVKVSSIDVLIWLGAVLCADLICLELLRYHIAPHFTEVVQGANGLRDFSTSCLEALLP